MEDIALPECEDDTPAVRSKRRWGKRLGWALALLLAPLVLLAGFLSTPIGKRYIADQIAAVAPASGLRFAVGRIEGDVYSKAVLRDVRVSDPKGVFLTIPEVALEWRPLNWLWSGLDIRELTARRGRLARLPELLPGDPDAPLLPDFDIRVDKLAIENLVIAEGVATPRAERVNALARIDIREGRALVDATAELGQRDRIALLLDAEPDGDRFDLEGEYRAPAGGVLAGLAGFAQGYDARIAGDGTWQRWRGWAVARRLDKGISGKPVTGPAVAAFQVTNAAGKIGVLGRVRPGLADRVCWRARWARSSRWPPVSRSRTACSKGAQRWSAARSICAEQAWSIWRTTGSRARAPARSCATPIFWARAGGSRTRASLPISKAISATLRSITAFRSVGCWHAGSRPAGWCRKALRSLTARPSPCRWRSPPSGSRPATHMPIRASSRASWRAR